jgi:hypothetical protein
LLSDTERTVFDRLGVFPASFDEAAAVAVCAIEGIERWDVIDALASLVAKSMVGAERSGDTARYQLLETLRHFARDLAGDLDGLRRRHARYFAGFAERAGVGAMSPEELVWWPKVEAEMDNLRSATSWAFDATATDDVALGVQILAGLAGVAFYRGGSGISGWASAGLGRADGLDAAQRQILAGLVALDANFLGQYERATALGQRVIAEAQTFNPGLLGALNAVSISSLAGGDFSGALAVLADGRTRLDASGIDDWMSVYMATVASFVAQMGGDYDTTRSEAERAVRDAGRIGAPTLVACALGAHAWAIADDDPEEALAAADECVQLSEAGAGDFAYSPNLALGAMLREAAGDQPGALDALRKAVEYDARTGNRVYMAMALTRTALVLAGSPDAFTAAATLDGALAGPVLGIVPRWLTPPQQKRYEQRLAAISAGLGEDGTARARRRGAAMTYDEIVAYTLDQLGRLADRSTTRSNGAFLARVRTCPTASGADLPEGDRHLNSAPAQRLHGASDAMAHQGRNPIAMPPMTKLRPNGQDPLSLRRPRDACAHPYPLGG